MRNDVINIYASQNAERKLAFTGIISHAAARHGLSVDKLIDYINNGWELPIIHELKNGWAGPYIAEVHYA